MTAFHACFLGMIQGITESLPVSSSAHLTIIPQLLGMTPQGKVFDVFLNMGSLLAVLVFFRIQSISLILGFKDLLMNKKTGDRFFFITILFSSIPTIVIFGIAEVFFDIDINSPTILSIATVLFAIILYICDRNPLNKKTVTRKESLLIGLAQTLSLIPGVSRLGACLSTMRYLNYSREESFRYSMILSIPPVAGACFLKLIKILSGKIIIENGAMIVFGSISAFIFALISLALVSNFLRKHTLLPIVIYRILFGISVYLHFYKI